MARTPFLIMVTALLTGNLLTGCQEQEPAPLQDNTVYKVVRQAEALGFTDTTFQRLQTILQQHQLTDFKSVFYYYNYGCGYYHTNKIDDQAALRYADSMLLLVQEHANDLTDQAEIAIANLSKGDILFALKQYNEAYSYYYRGKVAAERSKDLYILSEYSYRLGMVLYRKEQYSAACRFFKDGFEQGGHRKNSFSDFYRRQEELNNAALSYLNMHKPDSAVWCCNKALQYLADKEKEYPADRAGLVEAARGVLYGTMGQAYLQLHDTTGAGWLQKSIAINQLPHRENRDALYRQADLAQYYLDTTFKLQLSKAYSLLLLMQQGIDTLHSTTADMQWNALFSSYYALQNKPAAAFAYLTRYTALYRQQLDANKAFTEANLNSQLKLMQDYYELTSLTTNNRLNVTYLQIAVVLCVLSVIILFLIIRNWKKEVRNSRVQAVLNKQVEQQKIQLETTVKQLDHQVKTKDYILRVIAHDLRNPISAISTLTRIVGEEYENEKDNKEYLELAQSACKDSLAMIDSIMQLSQQDTGESLVSCVFDVNESVIDCVELLRLQAEEKNQQIVVHTAGTPQYTLADADKINRVVNNLVMNAIKFSFPNSTIDVFVKERANNVEIVVKDKGIGIPEDMQNKVFDVFTEAKRKGTSKEATFGLGLSICKQLVEAHDGKIWLESKEGLGSAFYVQLQKHTLAHPAEQEYKAEETETLNV